MPSGIDEDQPVSSLGSGPMRGSPGADHTGVDVGELGDIGVYLTRRADRSRKAARGAGRRRSAPVMSMSPRRTTSAVVGLLRPLQV